MLQHQYMLHILRHVHRKRHRDAFFLFEGSGGRCWTWGGIVSGISPEKRSICVSSSVALGRPVRHYYRGDCLERFGWADSTRTSGLGPNQEETAKWLKSRSTSQPPPRPPPPPSLILLHLPSVTVTSIPHSTLLLSLSCFLCQSRCSSPSPVSDRCCFLIVVSSIVSI